MQYTILCPLDTILRRPACFFLTENGAESHWALAHPDDCAGLPPSGSTTRCQNRTCDLAAALISRTSERMIRPVSVRHTGFHCPHSWLSLQPSVRQDTVDLLHQFTDEQLATAVPTVIGEQSVGELFAGRAEHAAEHMSSIEEGFR
jgi:hypothetical protein